MNVEVPGAPLSLRIERRSSDGRGHVVGWSYADPEQPNSTTRVEGTTTLRAGTDDEAWTCVQLDAARAFKAQVDADWEPGVAWEPRHWSVDEAWAALLDWLGSADRVHEVDGDVVVRFDGVNTSTLRLDPEEWAAYLSDPVDAPLPRAPYIVLAATPLDGGLPIWVTDELFEVFGSRGPLIGLIDGKRGPHLDDLSG